MSVSLKKQKKQKLNDMIRKINMEFLIEMDAFEWKGYQ